MMEEKKKNNTALIILVVLLIVACLGMGGYIFISKNNKFTGQTNTNNKDVLESEKKNAKEETECAKINYDLNTNEYGLGATAVGISVNVDKTRKSVSIFFNGAMISNSFGLGWVTSVETTSYQQIDTKTFDKKITQVLIDGSGQDASSSAIIYLMEDGTVEYVPILKDINTNWSQQDDTKKFNSYGKLNGISNIISLLPASANGYHTVLARKVDGTVIDLSDAFKSTGNFN